MAALAVDHWKGFISIRWPRYSCLLPTIRPVIIATTTHAITIPVRDAPSGASANRAHAVPKLIQPMIFALRFTASPLPLLLSPVSPRLSASASCLVRAVGLLLLPYQNVFPEISKRKVILEG